MNEQARGGTEVNSAPDVASEEVPKLTAIRGVGAGRAFAMVRTFAMVGRHPTNDFVVDDPRISGVHLELTRVWRRVRLRDGGNTNGTWLGAHRVLDVELAKDAEITPRRHRPCGSRSSATATIAALPEREGFGDLVGRSRMMRELFARLRAHRVEGT